MMSLLHAFRQQGAIDVTVYLGQWPFRHATRASSADLSAMADRLGLTGLCVSHIASVFGYDTRSGNEALLKETAADVRLWPFVILNPLETGWERELVWAAQAGARGVRLLPGYHGYSLRCPQMTALAAAIDSLGLPLQLCARLQDERLQHPRYPVANVPLHEIAELADKAGGRAPLLVSGLRESEWEQMLMHLSSDSPRERLFCDLWYCNGPLAVIASLCSRSGNGADTFAYGSCHPIQTAEATALQLAAANISETSRYSLCAGNARHFLGLSCR